MDIIFHNSQPCILVVTGLFGFFFLVQRLLSSACLAFSDGVVICLTVICTNFLTSRKTPFVKFFAESGKFTVSWFVFLWPMDSYPFFHYIFFSPSSKIESTVKNLFSEIVGISSLESTKYCAMMCSPPRVESRNYHGTVASLLSVSKP